MHGEQRAGRAEARLESDRTAEQKDETGLHRPSELQTVPTGAEEALLGQSESKFEAADQETASKWPNGLA